MPEAVKKKIAMILHILEQFKGKDLRPNTDLLDKVYKEQIQPILEQSSDTAALIIAEVLQIPPQEWIEGRLRTYELTTELASLLQIDNILDPDKSTLIFSEKVTFDNGLGILLPKLARSGMKVAVVATTDRHRALIDELNQGKPENERIVYAETIADIRAKVHTARYYYFKVNGDPDLQGITTFDITEIVKQNLPCGQRLKQGYLLYFNHSPTICAI